ncbi:hypothetical protein RFI_34124 [Reticulomyxa filosa]|uniref:Uncharacterized protein n=1 Tax=Reticulomyxa filosa TaxID=46433 RepID=X6LQ70_RETFI|nr:hypothetical protein RFI_34124 [Reticulomyxa filosa]|eukprot:ETO03287.1 hypothetical protein RFI_34124 [Reticulomyxa filosa]
MRKLRHTQITLERQSSIVFDIKYFLLLLALTYFDPLHIFVRLFVLTFKWNNWCYCLFYFEKNEIRESRKKAKPKREMSMSEAIQTMQETINKITDLNISSKEIEGMQNSCKKSLDDNCYQLMKKLFQLRMEGYEEIKKEFKRYSNEHVFSNVFVKLKKKKGVRKTNIKIQTENFKKHVLITAFALFYELHLK